MKSGKTFYFAFDFACANRKNETRIDKLEK